MQSLQSAESMMVYYGREICCNGADRPEQHIRKKFVKWFGTTPLVAAYLWRLIVTRGSPGILFRGVSPKFLLWAMLFLHQYPKEEVMSFLLKADPKTIRKWVWCLLRAVHDVADHVISWENRMIGNTPYRCKVTVDGTDFRIREPSGPFQANKRFFSHKYKTAGLRYEVAVCIHTGFIVWVHGPFPCGAFNDIKIFRLGLKAQIPFGERVEADNGYRGEPLRISTPDDNINPHQRRVKSLVRARHEQVNRRLKDYSCLHQLYRHSLQKHEYVFWSVAVITQISLQTGERDIWRPDYDGLTFGESLF